MKAVLSMAFSILNPIVITIVTTFLTTSFTIECIAAANAMVARPFLLTQLEVTHLPLFL